MNQTILKWNIGNDQSNANYNVGNETIYNTEVLNDTQVSFKNCVQFAKCMTKTDGTTIDDSEDLNFVMKCTI